MNNAQKGGVILCMVGVFLLGIGLVIGMVDITTLTETELRFYESVEPVGFLSLYGAMGFIPFGLLAWAFLGDNGTEGHSSVCRNRKEGKA